MKLSFFLDRDRREQLLSTAIDRRLSLTQIGEEIKSTQADLPAIDPATLEPRQRIQSTLKKATSAKVWQDPLKWKKIDKLLIQIDELLAGNFNFNDNCPGVVLGW